jgi:hypothetical protein
MPRFAISVTGPPFDFMRETTAKLFAGVLMKLISSVIAVLAALLFLYSFGVFDPPIVKACEARLKGYLAAPSTYERNRFFLGQRRGTRADLEQEYKGFPDIQSFYQKEFDNGSMKPVLYTTTINFSVLDTKAEKATTAITCQYFSTDGNISEISVGGVSILPADTTTYSQIVRDFSHDSPLTLKEGRRKLEPIAPYAGWIRDTLRRVFG